MKTMMYVISFVLSAMLSAQSAYAACATNVSETSSLESGVSALRKSTGISMLGLGSEFKEIDGKATFKIFADRKGDLFLDTPYGKFEATICSTSKGIEAHVPLEGWTRMMAGLDLIIFTLTGEKGRLKLTTNKPGEKTGYYLPIN